MTVKKIFALWLLLAVLTLCFISCDRTNPSPSDTVAHVHIYSDWETVVPATCTEMGILKGVCTSCGSEETILIPAVSHDFEPLPAIAPTCTEEGRISGIVCRNCGVEMEKPLTLPPMGHNEIMDPGKAPTCIADGFTDGKHCVLCGEITVPQTAIPATGHTEMTDLGKEATCTADGLTEGKHCSKCGEITVPQTAIPAKGHTQETLPRVEPTCTAQGRTEGVCCSVCDTVLAGCESIPAKGHTVVIDPRVEPTCTEDGLSEGQHCSVCGHILYQQVARPATGHTEMTDLGKEATCTADGLTEGKHCSKCGETIIKQTVLPAVGHHAVMLPSVPATCTKDGQTEGSACDRCGLVLIERTAVGALGHDYNERGSCVRCEATRVSEGLVFESLDDGSCVLVGMGTCTDAHIVIPRVSPEGDLVEIIAYDAFLDAVGLTSIAIPDTVTSVGSLFIILDPSVEVYFLGARTEWYTMERFEEYGDRMVTRYVHCADGDVFMCNSTAEDMGFEFTSNGDGTCYVSGIGTATDGVIPRYSPAGDLVTAIGEGALAEAWFSLVAMPDSVTHIGTNAFYKASFIAIALPETVTYIGDYAFYQLEGSWAIQCVCNEISRLPGLTYLGRYALVLPTYAEELTLILPDGITAIEDGLISGGYWSELTLTVPTSVTYIGNGIFDGWRAGASIVYRGTVEEWQAIEKHAGWNRNMPPITVTCTDGEVITEDRSSSLM